MAKASACARLLDEVGAVGDEDPASLVVTAKGDVAGAGLGQAKPVAAQRDELEPCASRRHLAGVQSAAVDEDLEAGKTALQERDELVARRGEVIRARPAAQLVLGHRHPLGWGRHRRAGSVALRSLDDSALEPLPRRQDPVIGCGCRPGETGLVRLVDFSGSPGVVSCIHAARERHSGIFDQRGCRVISYLGGLGAISCLL